MPDVSTSQAAVNQIVGAVLNQVPLYNPVIAGMPFYFWVIVFGVMIFAFVLMAVYALIYVPMKPVWGFRASNLFSQPCSIVKGRNGQIWFETTEYVAGIFNAMKLPLKWIITAPVTGNLGKAQITYMSDDWNVVHELDIDYAIVEICRRWNMHMRQEYPDTPIDQLVKDNRLVHNWDTFELHLMNGDLRNFIPKGITLPPLRTVDLNEVIRYLPKWTASHFSGYINSEVEKRLKEKAGPDMKENFKWALLCAALILGAGILAYLINR
jgi:hypothetical protein